MRYLFTICLIATCLAAGSGQTVDNVQDTIPAYLASDIKCMADSIAMEAGEQVDSIVNSKKLVIGRTTYIPAGIMGPAHAYKWYYRVIGKDSIFVTIK